MNQNKLLMTFERTENHKSPCGRIATGKKGLGKLALFGIGETIKITTYQESCCVNFSLDWNEILSCKGKDYEPKFNIYANAKNEKGTTISLTNLKRRTGFPLQEYANSIAKLFNFKDNFVVYLPLNNAETIKFDNKLKYKNISTEFEWNIQTVIAIIDKEYSEKNNIQGNVLTSKKTLSASLRGITLFANGRMVNSPEFFGPSESSHFYSYATCWLNVDFIDNLDEDVIATNRQSIDWENPKTIKLREYLANCLSHIEMEWRKFRKGQKQIRISDDLNLNIKEWLDKLPNNKHEQIEIFVNLLDGAPELSVDTEKQSIQILHRLVSEYPLFHWRHLDDDIKNAAKTDYQNKDYYRAFTEAMKRYHIKTRSISASKNGSDNLMLGEVYGKCKVFSVTRKFKKQNGTDFTKSTIENIEEGQNFLSLGILEVGRKPVSHEEIRDLRFWIFF